MDLTPDLTYEISAIFAALRQGISLLYGRVPPLGNNYPKQHLDLDITITLKLFVVILPYRRRKQS